MITLKIDGGLYNSYSHSEAWLTRISTGQSMLVELWHPGWQYQDAIKEIFRNRGFEFNFR